LFRELKYEDAATELWKAVLWHGKSPDAYNVQECFEMFLQCYVLQDKLADGLAYVSYESFRRGQADMGKNYLRQALEVDPNHEKALAIQNEYITPKNEQVIEISEEDDTNADLQGKTSEQLYEVASESFTAREYEECADVFEISCLMSQERLFPSCANAVYCRNTIADWGFNGTQFDRDMKRISNMVVQEVKQYRIQNETGSFGWQRATSVHPHMMLGYPLPAVLKQHVTESVAYVDERAARVSSGEPLPDDLPFQNWKTDDNTRIKVGFVGCGFNSKAVLFLSHDMFRFFDRDKFEVHVFSFGPPDNPMFIEHGMRGVDWRKRVQSNVFRFHDMTDMRSNHVQAARYIHDQGIGILVEWDGYARQGERAQGLLALRPAPIQMLHQEYLGTSGALYVDYLFSDQITSPPRLQELYTEKIIYLPNHFFSKGHAYQKEVLPPTYDYKPATTPYTLGTGSPQENNCMAKPSGTKTSFVFCSFNKFLKFNPETMRSWIRILREVPGSTLCLLENPKEGVPYLRRFVHEDAATSTNNTVQGMNAGDGDELNKRIHFLTWERNPFDHQRRSQDFCNVMVDSYPYNGHTTANDALYAGVPIVTRSDGDDMCSRVTTSANIVLGLDRLNAKSPTEYEDIAIQVGTNATLYHELRTPLIDSCLQKNPRHPYWDVARYVKNFETGLTAAWQRYVHGQSPDHIYVEETPEAARGTYEEEIIARPPDGPGEGRRDEL
jgi:protein O-GlcNAc transferase